MENGVIVCSSFLSHLDVARNYNVKSAGFCELNGNGNWVVSGSSQSLECCHRPQEQDVEILNQHLIDRWPVHFVDQPVSRQAI
jgi:hypothetical protein